MIKRRIKLARLVTIKRARKALRKSLFKQELEKCGFLVEKAKDIRKNHPDLFGGRG